MDNVFMFKLGCLGSASTTVYGHIILSNKSLCGNVTPLRSKHLALLYHSEIRIRLIFFASAEEWSFSGSK